MLAVAVAVFSATQDIVLDAYRREILDTDAELALGNTIHVQAYRVAGLVPGAAWRESGPEEADLALETHPAGGRWGAYDIARLTEDCGWRPRPLDEALAEYRDWLAAHPY